MSEETKKRVKEHFKSAVKTFAAGFLATLLIDLQNPSLEVLQGGLLVTSLFTATRVGLKALIEDVLKWL